MGLRRLGPWVPTALLLAATPAAWGQVRRGGEIQVNEHTTGGQQAPAVAVDGNGNFVVVWTVDLSDVWARRFDAGGNPLAGSFRVNTYTPGPQHSPAVASDPAGNLAVVWTSLQDGGGYGVYARRFDPSGNPIGGQEFRVNAFTTGTQAAPVVAFTGNGGFVVSWLSLDDGSSYGVFARVYNASGVPTTTTDIPINSFTTGQQSWPAVAADAAGNFIVAWSGSGSGDNVGVFARRFDAAGAPFGGQFQVNTYVTRSQYYPMVAMAPDGRFMVAWPTEGQDGRFLGTAARRYDAAGLPLGPDFIVNVQTLSNESPEGLAADGEGNFIVTFNGDDGDVVGMFARRYDAAGAPSAPFQVNTYTTSGQYSGVVAAAPNGDFVVAWASYGQVAANNADVFAQRFSPDVIFQDDFELASLARWSSSSTDGGDLSPSAFAALDFSSIGLQGVVDDTAGIFVADESPENEDVYRARFWFDPNGFNPGEAQLHLRTRIFIVFEEAPSRRLAAVVLRRQSGAYSLMGRARLDDNSQENTGFFPISDGPHAVEIAWRRSSGPAEEDGEFQMWIDGVLMSTRSNLDNSLSAVDFARMGALSVKTGAAGTMYWDEFESRRGSYIAP